MISQGENNINLFASDYSQIWSALRCCRNGCELGWHWFGYLLWEILVGLSDHRLSTTKRVESTNIRCISMVFVHATLSICSGNLLVEWPNGSLIMLKQIIPYVTCIRTLYRKKAVTKTNPVS